MRSVKHTHNAIKALYIILALMVVAAVPGLERLGMILVPGGLLAALIFCDGIHSDHGWLFLGLAGILDWLIAWGCILIVQRLRRDFNPLKPER